MVGYYRRTFDVPAAWLDGGRGILQAEGIAASAEVYINEQCICYHDGGFVPFQMDVTAALTEGAENLIAVRVVKADISTVHDNSGQWMLSGIWRDLFLFHVPAAHITDCSVHVDFDSADGTGTATAAVHCSPAANGLALRAALLGWETDDVLAAADTEVAGGAATVAVGSTAIRAWNPEQPHLYRLRLELVDGREVLETIGEQVGFCRFEAQGERFLLNGRPFLIRGVTRHEIKQGCGRTLSVADMRHEIRLMREAGITGVRSHPYPFDPRWIRLCARHGILVCSGFCLCGYNSWGNPWAMSEEPTYPAHELDFDPGYRHLFSERYHYFAPLIYGCYKNLFNVFAWSIANESSISEIAAPVARFLHDRDDGRFRLAAGDRNINGAGYDDKHPELQELIATVRWKYLNADSEHDPERRSAEDLQQSLPWNFEQPRPMFYTEAAHPCCNRDNFCMDPAMLGDFYGRGLQRTFDAIRTMPGAAGFFIFEWSDQSVMQKGDPARCDSFLREWHGYATLTQNLKGLLGPNHEPKPAYHSARKVYVPVRFEVQAVRPRLVRIGVVNDQTFRDLAELRFDVLFHDDAHELAPPQSLALAAAPQAATVAEIALPAIPGLAAITIRAFDPAWPGPVAERTVRLPQSLQNTTAATQPLTALAAEAAWTGVGGRRVHFIEPAELSLGLIGGIARQRYLNMGHLPTNTVPDGVVTAADVVDQQDRVLCAGNAWRRNCRLANGGQIRSDISCTADGQRLCLQQELQYNGDEIWLTGLGLRFILPAAYRQLEWQRRAGVWTEYPEDHPDRLRGKLQLGQDEYPPVNPFRWPSFAQLAHIRNVDTVVLSGDRVPPLRLRAAADGRRVVVRMLADHSREILLLWDCYCCPPYAEFSFLRTPAARRSLLGLEPLNGSGVIRQTWSIDACGVHHDQAEQGHSYDRITPAS